MNALFDALDHFSGADYILVALIAGAGVVWIVQILSEASAHRSWAQRQSDFADAHPRERVGVPLAPSVSPPRGPLRSGRALYRPDNKRGPRR